MTNALNKFRVINTIAFIIICLSIGQVMSALLTGLIYDVSTSRILDVLENPISTDRNIILLFSLFFTLFSFFITPTIYLLFYNKNSLSFLWVGSRIRLTPLILSTITVFTIIPFITILAKLNYSIEFPIWLSELESYFKQGEEQARLLTSSLISITEFEDLIIVILIMAIIPGIVEELFFRGMVQRQLQEIFKTSHCAIFLGAILFSFFHFQFYGFIPRLISGVLFGYIFVWSKNIWYSCAAHVTNNAVSVLGVYFMGPQVLNPEGGRVMSILLIFPSVVATALIILFLKKNQAATVSTAS